MVCTGDTLIYGVQMTPSDIKKCILRYIKSAYDSDSYKIVKDDLEDFEPDDMYEIINYVDKLLHETDISIRVIRPPCCLYSTDPTDDFSLVYLGVELCSNSLVSRFHSIEFNSIEEYEKSYTSGLVDAKKLLEENKTKYLEDLAKFIPKTKNKPKFYTIPNDCFSCT